MKYLVTGASGFIGSSIINLLVDDAHEVIGVSRSMPRIKPAGNFLWEKVDLADENLNLPDCEVCIHCAGVSPGQSSLIQDFIKNNSLATLNLVKALRGTSCKKIIYLSSVSIHGDLNQDYIDEKSGFFNPGHYGLSKIFSENIFFSHPEISTSIIRLPGVLGPSAKTPWIVKIIKAMKNNEQINLYGIDGRFNNAVHVQDLYRFILQLVSLGANGGNVYTIGARSELTIKEIFGVIKRETGSKSSIRELNIRKNRFLINSSKSIEVGYMPMDLEEMLLRQISDEES
jgi:nucleoside-diphosphate-sugar epimerase